MAVPVSTVLQLVRDYSRNQALTEPRGIRAINSAYAMVMNVLGLPGSEREYIFQFDETQPRYVLPVDYAEAISLGFNGNFGQNWDYPWRAGRIGNFRYRPVELLSNGGWGYGWYGSSRWNLNWGSGVFGDYMALGFWQMYILGCNSLSPVGIDTFSSDNTINWLPTDDANNVTTDIFVYQYGGASLKFDIFQNVATRGTLTSTNRGTFDFTSQQAATTALFKMWVYIPNVTDFDSISLKFGSAPADHYVSTVTTQEDASPFVVGWNMVAFPMDGAVVIGTPDITQIDWFQVNFDYDALYVPTDGFRMSWLRLIVPDPLTLTYYTSYKGKETGGAFIRDFTDVTDTMLFGDMDSALQEVIAIQAAVLLNPQILVEDINVRRSYEQFTKIFKARYPRKRIKNLLADPVQTATTEDIQGGPWGYSR